MRRPTPTAVLLLVATALVAWLIWSELESAGVVGARRRGPEGAAYPSRTESEAIARDLRDRARLRGMPGLDAAERGAGRLSGAVMLYGQGGADRPLPGVTVEIHGHVDGEAKQAQATTDERGRFAFPALAASPSYALVIRHAPYRDVLLRGIRVLPQRVTDVGSIVLGAPTVLRGSVVDHTGRPVGGAQVQVFLDRTRPFRRHLQEALRELQAMGDPVQEVLAASDGRFLLRDLPPSRYVLRVSAAGHATSFREGVWVTPDERAPEIMVVLDPGAGCEGRVLDEGGRGIDGARVIAVAVRGKNTRGLDRVETRSAPDGAYRLDALIPGVQYFVEAWAEGHAPAGRLVQPQGMQAIDFELGVSGGIEGRILDAQSKLPVSGARVMVIAGLVNRISPLTTVADPAGRFSFPAVSAGPVLVFAAEADGYPASSFTLGGDGGHVVQEAAVTVIDLELEPGVRVVGRIVDARGRPVPYATITFSDPKRRSDPTRSAISATDGRYEVEGLRPDTLHEVRIQAAGFAPFVEDDEARVAITQGFMELDFVLEPGAALAGRVVDPEGAPVRGARVSVEARGGRRVAERVQDLVAVSGPAGAWTIAGVPPRVELVVRAEHDTWSAVETAPLSLRAGETRDVALTLGRGARLEGRVVDARGSPVADARVRWGPIAEGEEGRTRDAFRADQLLGPRVVRTSADGVFVLDRLEAGTLVVKVEADGHPDWYRRDLVVPADGDPLPLRVELETGAPIAGRVLDAVTRRPVEGVWIYARRQDDANEESGEREDPGRIRPLVSIQTDAEGRYELPPVPPGRYEVVAWFALGYRTAAQEREEPSCRRSEVGAGAKDVDFLLVRAE